MKNLLTVIVCLVVLHPSETFAQMSKEMRKAQNIHIKAIQKQNLTERDKAATAYWQIINNIPSEAGNAYKLLGELYSFHSPESFREYTLSLRYYLMADSLITEQQQNDKANVLYNLGIFYYRGAGVAQDFNKAKEYWIRSAELNDKYLTGLGEMYELGLGEEPNLNKALEYFYRSALTGNDTWAKVYSLQYIINGMDDSTLDTDAYQLYQKYMYEISVNNRPFSAFNYILQAAEKGFLPAECELSSLYASGTGTPANYPEAKRWALHAAGQGYVPAMNNYAVFIQSEDMAEAFLWFNKAAEGGLPVSQAAVGHYYQYGLSGSVDYNKAEFYYRYSADQGCQLGQTRLDALPRYIKTQQFTETMQKLSNTFNSISNILVSASNKYLTTPQGANTSLKTKSQSQNNNSADFWISEYYRYEQKVKKGFESCINTVKTQKIDFSTGSEHLFRAQSGLLRNDQKMMTHYRQSAAECGKIIPQSKWETEDLLGWIKRELR